MAQFSAQSGEVIAISQHKAAMMHPSLGLVLQHWEGLCQGNQPPARDALDPRDLTGLLSNIFILERSRPATVRLRLGGTHLTDLMGMEVRGLPIRAFFELSERTRLMSEVEQVFTRPAKLMLHLTSDKQGQAVLDGQMLLLPMLGANGQIERALGVIATTGPLGLRPRRFRIKRAKLTPLESGIAANGQTAEAPPKFAKGKPALTLIQGGLAEA